MFNTVLYIGLPKFQEIPITTSCIPNLNMNWFLFSTRYELRIVYRIRLIVIVLQNQSNQSERIIDVHQ
jgi:hypothetical protein